MAAEAKRAFKMPIPSVTGMTKIAAVEKAVDEMLKGTQSIDRTTERARMHSLLAQFDRTRPNPESVEAITWDEFGLPK